MNNDLRDCLDRVRDSLVLQKSGQSLKWTMNYIGAVEQEREQGIDPSMNEEAFEAAVETQTGERVRMGFERLRQDLEHLTRIGELITTSPEHSWTFGGMLEGFQVVNVFSLLLLESDPQSADDGFEDLAKLTASMRPELLRSIAAIRNQAINSRDKPPGDNENHPTEAVRLFGKCDPIYPVSELARRLHVSRSVVHKWAKERTFPTTVNTSGTSTYRWSEVVDWCIQNGKRIAEGR